MNYRLYGYLIGKDFHFDISSRCLYRLTFDGSEKSIMFGALFFNDTMAHLFLYLLDNARTGNVTKEELLMRVWVNNGLRPSTQRLWQVFTSLNKKMSDLGMPEKFIQYSKGNGYRIDYSDITPLYYRAPL